MADDLLGPLISRIERVERGLRSAPRLVWATVAASAPLRVVVDGDDVPMAGTPSSLVKVLVPGGRVRCELQGRRLTVLAVAGRPRGIPEGTTAQRNALSAAGVVPVGMQFWNTTTEWVDTFDGSAWLPCLPSGRVSIAGVSIDPGSTVTKLAFGAPDYADGVTWSDANDRFTIVRAGWYQLSAHVIWNNSGTGLRLIQGEVAGAASQIIWNRTTQVSGNIRQESVGEGLLSAGDTVALLASHASADAGARITAASLAVKFIRP